MVEGTCIAAFVAANYYDNSGTTKQLYWVGAPANHQTVMAENLYRLKDNHFEQIGMAWIKHVSSAGTLPSETCCAPESSAVLGIGCVDVYSTFLNGRQWKLGPRGMANAVTGQLPPLNNTCHTDPPVGQENICGRLQAATADLDDVSATYFVELQATTPCEDLRNNNPSYREIAVTRPTQPCTCGDANCTYTIVGAPGSTTVVGKPAIKAWKAADSTVVETEIYVQEDVSANETNCESECQVEDDSLLILAAKATDLGNGSWAYEYALHNLNSHRGVEAFRMCIASGTQISNVGFHDVDYHSGEELQIDTSDWTWTVSGTSILWEAPDATGKEKNALRGGRYTTSDSRRTRLPTRAYGPSDCVCIATALRARRRRLPKIRSFPWARAAVKHMATAV